MKINPSQIIALLALVVIGLWFALNTGKDKNENKSSNMPSASQTVTPTVVTQSVSAEPHTIRLKLFGRTEATREVMVKAQTPGAVVSTPVAEGIHVKKGALLCRQDVNARQASLDQALAQLKAREVDYNAAAKLVERGFASDTQLLGAQAGLDAAKAAVKQARIELDNINIRAPFNGIFERQMAEVGDYLAPGQPCGSLLELNPLTVSINLTESQIKTVEIGQETEIELATGETVVGKIRMIEPRANPATRTFKSEIAIDNTDLKLKAGVSATVILTGAETDAHLIPSAIIGLNDDGRIGVKYLDDETVYFAETQTIDETQDGIWVTGLPRYADIIIQGQEYVAQGAKAIGKDVYAQ